MAWHYYLLFFSHSFTLFVVIVVLAVAALRLVFVADVVADDSCFIFAFCFGPLLQLWTPFLKK